jgi:Zn-dependent protease with chaperone function
VIEIEGTYFDGQSSTPHRSRLIYTGNGTFTIRAPTGDRTTPVKDIRISDRLANAPRVLRLADGSSFETRDNDGVDRLLLDFGQTRWPARGVHLLESRWRYVVLAALLTIGVVGFWLEYGIPALADHVAKALPASTSAALGDQSMRVLDKLVFTASELPQQTTTRIRARFRAMAATLRSPFDYRLEFRKGGTIGANAVALPSGLIVMTDELVRLSDHDEELLAILAHEFGHVEHRHSLRMIFQNSAVALVIASVTGDIFSITATAATVPTILIQTKFSREFEIEADEFSRDYLHRHGIPLERFANILRRLHDKGSAQPETPGFLSTHPLLKERLHMFEN